jgi:hypothetical protein
MSKICCQIAVKARNVSNTNRLKPLVEVLEQSRGSSNLLGMPKGGLLPINCLTMPLHRLPYVLEQLLLEENWAW